MYATFDYPFVVKNEYGTQPSGISESYVVGDYYDTNNVKNGFLYNISTGSYTNFLDPLAVNGGSSEEGISGSYVVGDYYDANNVDNGFLYNIGTGMYTTLDDPLGVNGTTPLSISGNYVVGRYIDANNVEHGFLYNVAPPSLNITQAGSNSVIVSWANIGSYSLQQNRNPALSAGWVTSGFAIDTNSATGTNSITISSPTGDLFFRLVNP
jgi:hypothetical protein